MICEKCGESVSQPSAQEQSHQLCARCEYICDLVADDLNVVIDGVIWHMHQATELDRVRVKRDSSKVETICRLVMVQPIPTFMTSLFPNNARIIQ